MHRIRKTLLASLVLALAASPGLLAAGDRITVPLSDPAKPAKVEITLPSGAVRVEGYDGAEVVVEIEPVLQEVRREREPREDGLQRIANAGHSLIVEEKNNKVEIASQGWDEEETVNLTLKVPRSASLVISTMEDGEIDVKGVHGDLELNNVDDSIKVADVRGNIAAQTVDGDIEVRIAALGGGKPLSFSTLEGDIDLRLPAAAKADFRIRAMQGEILTDFDLQVQSTSNEVREGGEGKGFRWAIEKEVRASINGGGQEIVLKSFEGDVLIRKARE